MGDGLTLVSYVLQRVTFNFIAARRGQADQLPFLSAHRLHAAEDGECSISYYLFACQFRPDEVPKAARQVIALGLSAKDVESSLTAQAECPGQFRDDKLVGSPRPSAMVCFGALRSVRWSSTQVRLLMQRDIELEEARGGPLAKLLGERIAASAVDDVTPSRVSESLRVWYGSRDCRVVPDLRAYINQERRKSGRSRAFVDEWLPWVELEAVLTALPTKL